MKITLGIDGTDSPETVQSYVDEGADEFFAGYMSKEWANTFGWEVAPNRRPFGPEFQFTSLSCLKEVIQAAREKGAELAVTLNAQEYCADQLPLLENMVSELESADPAAYRHAGDGS